MNFSLHKANIQKNNISQIFESKIIFNILWQNEKISEKY